MSSMPFAVINIDKEQADYAQLYLQHYGYDLQDLENEIKRFQNSFNLVVDGIVGPQTIKAMVMAPRCGFTDQQFAVDQLNKWGLDRITWFFEGKQLHQNQEQIISKAFKNISDVIDVTFEKALSGDKANIFIHSSSDKTQGLGSPGNVLGYAYLVSEPNFTGQLDVYIDLAERWIEYGELISGIELENVLTHEFLHSMGLTHSTVKTALLAPTYAKGRNKPVSPDDIERLLQIGYKPAKVITNPPNPPDNTTGITVFIPGGRIAG